MAMTRLEKLNRRMQDLNKDGTLSEYDYNTFKLLLILHSNVDETFDPDGNIKDLDVQGITSAMCNLMEPV